MTGVTRPDQWDTVNWPFIAARFNEAMAALLHHEDSDLRGDAFYTEALRRALSDHRCGVMPTGQHEHEVEQAIATWKFNADQARRDATEWQDKYQALVRIQAKSYVDAHAAAIRGRLHNLVGKYRQEGARWAADLLDGGQPAANNTDSKESVA